MKTNSIVGMDIAKSVMFAARMNEEGQIIERRKFSRNQLMVWLANIPRSLIGFEGCGGAHYLANEISKLGISHEAKIIPAQYVAPYRKGEKNDWNDAIAAAEAVQRKNMRFVSIKSAKQLELQSIQRIRSRLIKEHTAIINQIHGFLLEQGVVIPKGRAALRRLHEVYIKYQEKLTGSFIEILKSLYAELLHKEAQISEIDTKMKIQLKDNLQAQKLLKVPGIGPVTAMTLMVSVGDPKCF